MIYEINKVQKKKKKFIGKLVEENLQSFSISVKYEELIGPGFI